MNRFATLATSLTVAGTVLLGSAAAADPAVHMTSSGSPMPSGSGASYGQLVDLSVTGCLTPGGDPGYVGQFVNWRNDPEAQPMHFETITDETGGLFIQSNTPLTTYNQYMDLNWYCSTAPATGMDDPNIIWLSPTFDYTIAAAPEGAGVNRTTQNQKVTVTTKATTSTTSKSKLSAKKKAPAKAPVATANPGPKGGAVTMTVDPNALPKVDRMGIVGPKAAALKTKVDNQISANHRLDKLIQFLTGRKPAPVSNAEYVTTSFQVLTGKGASAKTKAAYIARLDAGELRVQVVEDIALTKKSAAQWNK